MKLSDFAQRGPGARHRVPLDSKGLSLIEAIIGIVISIIAISSLAYSFGIGRGFIYRFDVSRRAMGLAQARMEYLGTLRLTSDSLAFGPHPTTAVPFVYEGTTIGTESWTVEPPPPATPAANALKLVTVRVTWTQTGSADSITYARLVPRP
ncbi:MAG: hypothetical protein ABIU54_01160 [Candidatus Eisenbacteria bacterium]